MPRAYKQTGWILTLAPESPGGSSQGFYVSARVLAALKLCAVLLVMGSGLAALNITKLLSTQGSLLASNEDLRAAVQAQALELSLKRELASVEGTEAHQLISALGPTLAQLGEAVREVQMIAGLKPSARTDYSTLSAGIAVGGPNEPDALSKVAQVRAATETLQGEADALYAFAREARERLLEQQARAAATPHAWPARGFVSSPFGLRLHPLSGRRQQHKGLDIAAPYGTPVAAPAPGKVVRAGWNTRGYGNQVVIDHGYGFKTMYAHLRDVKVAVGDVVALDTLLGHVGSTGNSTGPHLHYEVWMKGVPIDPNDYLP